MRSARIVGAGIACWLFATLAIAGAAAQTPGAPLPLLQFVHHQTKAAVHPDRKQAARAAKTAPAERRVARGRLARTHRVAVAARRTAPPAATADPAAPAATTALPPNIWPTTDADAPGAALAANSPTLGPQPASGSVATEAVVDTDPNEILGNKHAVPAATPNMADPADSAATAPGAVKPTPTPASAAAPPPGLAAAAPEPVVHAMVARPTVANAQASSPIDSTSWIAHVLAALGGAIAAGAVAWFLIRPAPKRTYG
jgi:hypothetical protein